MQVHLLSHGKIAMRDSKKDSGHNQAVASIEATTHSYDSEIRKLMELTLNPPHG